MLNPYFLLMIAALLLASVSQILLKKSSMAEHSSFIREYLNARVIGGYALLAVSMVLVIFCYRGLGYMGGVVMEPISYIIVLFLSRFIFGEKITLRKAAGMLLILAGIAVFYLV